MKKSKLYFWLVIFSIALVICLYHIFTFDSFPTFLAKIVPSVMFLWYTLTKLSEYYPFLRRLTYKFRLRKEKAELKIDIEISGDFIKDIELITPMFKELEKKYIINKKISKGSGFQIVLDTDNYSYEIEIRQNLGELLIDYNTVRGPVKDFMDYTSDISDINNILLSDFTSKNITYKANLKFKKINPYLYYYFDSTKLTDKKIKNISLELSDETKFYNHNIVICDKDFSKLKSTIKRNVIDLSN